MRFPCTPPSPVDANRILIHGDSLKCPICLVTICLLYFIWTFWDYPMISAAISVFTSWGFRLYARPSNFVITGAFALVYF